MNTEQAAKLPTPDDPRWFTGAYNSTIEELGAQLIQEELGRKSSNMESIPESRQLPAVHQSTMTADGVTVFFRHAGPESPTAPTIVLLHGFPSSSFMFRNLIPHLALAGYRVFAPDLPGFGFTDVDPARGYHYTFQNLAATFEAFNGNLYREGLARPFWAPFEAYWAQPTPSHCPPARDALRCLVEYPATRWRYTQGSPSLARRVSLEPCDLDQTLLDRPGIKEVQLDLFHDYRSNVELYPAFQRYLAQSVVPVLAVWGRHDPIYTPDGAVAFRRDVRDMEIRWIDAGHFALEGNEVDVAGAMCEFFDTYYIFSPLAA
ncbi:twin-arginine translocation pathway signal [Pyricularia oryzae Y34]|uniref:Twin-arginine translocation pathway signal n=1 Tax=Pyricularia oryzae (strain Y34) TaxID=1143189 RepID=A0AA97NTJ3_PYRO3|nr:twin-arginine translocation pathway signal [Pyricularia oryzae Y34]